MERSTGWYASLGAIVLAAGLLGAGWLAGADARLGTPGVPEHVAFAIAIAAGEVIRFEQRRSRPVPLAVAAVGTFALLGASPLSTVAVAGTGFTLGTLVRRYNGHSFHATDLVQRLAGAWASAGVAGFGIAAAPDLILRSSEGAPLVHVGSLALVSAQIIVGTPIWEAVDVAASQRVPAWPVLVGRFQASWRSTVVLASVAALAALVYDLLGGWTLVLMALPLLAARTGLNRFAEVREMYDQTVRAMAKVPEVTGAAHEGHGFRVGELAVLVARDLGLSETTVADVEAASYLHEVGQLTAEEHERTDDQAIAAAGAGLVREAGTMPEVATIIARHREPYRRVKQPPGEEEVPMAARIVRTACDFDRWHAPGGPGRSVWDALERLHLGMAYDHDPIVIKSLTRVLERRGEL